MWLKALISSCHIKVLVFESSIAVTYVGKMKILDYFMIAHGQFKVLKGSFPISKVLVFRAANSYVCWI